MNGSGKSGYVRLLKHICGAKNAGLLHSNVFNDQENKPSCKITCKINDKEVELMWNSQGVVSELSSIEIYDTDCGNLYVTSENEVTYEPKLLSFLTSLVNLCTRINKDLADEISKTNSCKAHLPVEFLSTVSGNWYKGLTHSTSNEDIEKYCYWDETSEDERKLLNNRISEQNFEGKISALRINRGNLLDIIIKLKEIAQKYSDSECNKYIDLVNDFLEKKNVVDIDAKLAFSDDPLDGVGTKSWNLLWQKAREYSEEEAYKGIKFPNVLGDAKCVLCQQPLSIEAKKRFSTFECFVKGELAKEAQKAAKRVEALETILQDKPSRDWVVITGLKAELSEAIQKRVLEYYDSCESRYKSLLEKMPFDQIQPMPSEDIFNILYKEIEKLDKQIKGFETDAQSLDLDELKERLKNIEARKWLSQQKKSIEKEVDILKYIHQLENARQLTNTYSISVKKSNLAEELITSAFVERFDKEINNLGACRIPVYLEKTRTSLGRVYHQIRLKNCKQAKAQVSNVLSEGEFRIISLAAFLADAEGRASKSTFIFDDPISSLDQDFEEATVNRLVQLAASRQVIVFTHRLSLLVQMEDAAKKQDVALRKINVWGKGEPSETAINASKPIKELNKLINERLHRAEKLLKETSRTAYEEQAKGIIGDFRILLERFIESDLLSDVVQRFRRDVTTKNKIENLSLITPQDCKLFDDMMTRYSKYVHSQPYETPVLIPEPQELRQDMLKIALWHDDFESRKG